MQGQPHTPTAYATANSPVPAWRAGSTRVASSRRLHINSAMRAATCSSGRGATIWISAFTVASPFRYARRCGWKFVPKRSTLQPSPIRVARFDDRESWRGHHQRHLGSQSYRTNGAAPDVLKFRRVPQRDTKQRSSSPRCPPHPSAGNRGPRGGRSAWCDRSPAGAESWRGSRGRGRRPTPPSSPSRRTAP